MKTVLVDFHQLQTPSSFEIHDAAKGLALALAREADTDLRLHFYVPKNCVGAFGEAVLYHKLKNMHRFYWSGTGKFNLWHTTTALSPYQPFSKNVRQVYTIDHLHFLSNDPVSRAKKSNRLRLVQERIDGADYLVFHTDQLRLQAYQYFNLGNKPNAVIYPGCSGPSGEPLPVPAQLPSAPFLFSTVPSGSASQAGLLSYLLQGNEYLLVMAGEGEMPESLLASPKGPGLAQRVVWLNSITAEERLWYISACEAFVFPWTTNGFQTPVAEAMAFGKPVFLSLSGSLPELGGEVAYYFESFDGASLQKTFAEGMQHYIQTGNEHSLKDRAALFSWKEAAKQYLQLYRQLL